MCVVSQKKDYLFLNGVTKLQELEKTFQMHYNNFSVTQIWAKIFEIKVDPGFNTFY